MTEITNNIQCVNLNCLNLNPDHHLFCQKCGTPIIRRYLYTLGDSLQNFNEGDLVGDRYLVQKNNFLLDLKPGSTPLVTEDLPHHITPYLRLFNYRENIPQVYGFTTLTEESEEKIWLLEYFTTATEQPLPEIPKLSEVWPKATAKQQLHWLWQIAQLWDSCYEENVASSLVEPSLIRVRGNIIKIKELHLIDKRKTPLKLLGHLWSSLVQTADPTIKNLLENISKAIIQQQIINGEQLVDIIDQAIEECSKTTEYIYQICAYTDVGKSRDNNEDSCYPPPHTYVKINPKEKVFAMVCDGIGGHEGGEVASKIAIDFLADELTKMSLSPEILTPPQIRETLKNLTGQANDLISNRNNSEERFKQRERMGTTLVMTFADKNQAFFTNVGDSRVYRINQDECQQITVDDDLASRQVRLGYTLYRDAVLYPGAGGLIQALGMNPSNTLFPTVQRYIIEEDTVFLLCSDGLSDFDRVDQYWEQEILPILTEERSISRVGKRLIEIANQTNGHDNITVALIYCQVKNKPETEDIKISYEELISIINNLPVQEQKLNFTIDKSTVQQLTIDPSKTTLTEKDRLVENQKKRQKKNQIKFSINLILTLFIVFGSLYLIYAWVLEPIRKKILQPNINLEIGTILKTKNNLTLYPTPNETNNNSDGVDEITPGTILEITKTNEDNSWLEIKVCHSVTNNSYNQIPEGKLAWGKNDDILNNIQPDFSPDQLEKSWCEEKVNFQLNDIIKTMDTIRIENQETSLTIPPETIMKVMGITQDQASVQFEICTPNNPENNPENNPILNNITPFISSKDFFNKIDLENINNIDIKNTNCNQNKEQIN